MERARERERERERGVKNKLKSSLALTTKAIISCRFLLYRHIQKLEVTYKKDGFGN